ncbi:MAG: hypothetical protein MJE66_06105, partial [Proteobacteria bacterium]|nr:hypothetical protein [Pseudomonadota bacterium]
ADSTVLVQDAVTVTTTGDQVYGREATLAQDATFVGANVRFLDTLESTTAGALVVEAEEQIQFARGVGNVTAPTSIELEYGGSVEIGDLDNTGPLAVRAEQSIAFNEDGGGASPFATVFQRNGDLTIETTAGGDIVFGRNEKLSVGGDATLRAPSVQLGDATIAGRLTVDADNFAIRTRPGGTSRTSSGSFVPDSGVDVLANEFDFRTNPTVEGGGRNPIFGLPDPSAASPFLKQRFEIAALKEDGSRLRASDLDCGGVACDLRPEGPGLTSIGEVFAERGPSPDPWLIAPLQESEPQRLAEVGVDVRALSPEESAARQLGVVIVDDVARGRVADDGASVADLRLHQDEARRASELLEEVFGADFERTEELRQVLADAVADFRSETGVDRVSGFEFRRYLNNRPSSQFPAYRTLNDLDRLLRHHRRSGLAPAEYQRIQRGWLERIAPEGLPVGELAEAIHPTRYLRGSDILDVFGR